jgi:hypothetical protein
MTSGVFKSFARSVMHQVDGNFWKLAADWMDKPQKGKWPAKEELPRKVQVRGKVFVRSTGLQRHGAVAQYREQQPTDSRHLYVLPDQTYVIDHADKHNPHSSPIRHFLLDVLRG